MASNTQQTGKISNRGRYLESPVGWPLGMPHVRLMGKGLHEVRSNLPSGIARILFMVNGGDLILLHGFIKKTQKTPLDALALAERRRREYEQGKKD